MPERIPANVRFQQQDDLLVFPIGEMGNATEHVREDMIIGCFVEYRCLDEKYGGFQWQTIVNGVLPE